MPRASPLVSTVPTKSWLHPYASYTLDCECEELYFRGIYHQPIDTMTAMMAEEHDVPEMRPFREWLFRTYPIPEAHRDDPDNIDDCGCIYCLLYMNLSHNAAEISAGTCVCCLADYDPSRKFYPNPMLFEGDMPYFFSLHCEDCTDLAMTYERRLCRFCNAPVVGKRCLGSIRMAELRNDDMDEDDVSAGSGTDDDLSQYDSELEDE